MSQPTPLENLSGYSDTRDLLATRYNRGATRSILNIALPLHLIPSHLPKPDPDEPFEGNRRVDLAHARKFARYWRGDKNRTAPPPLLDTKAEIALQAELSPPGRDPGGLSPPLYSVSTPPTPHPPH